MTKSFKIAAYAALLSASTPALAGPNWVVQPMQAGQETVRYERGVATVGLELNDGVVQVTPLPLDHGDLSFLIAVYNDSLHPANFGIEHIAPVFDARPVRVFSKDDLVRKAKNRALWSQIGLAFLGAVVSTAAASQRDYYSNRFVTPHGTYRSFWSMPSVAGQYQAAAIAGSTGVGMALIQIQLDRTIATFGNQVIQLTTVDPGESYAGFVVIDKINPRRLPAQVQVTVNWNGEAYPFAFQVAKTGTPEPVFTALTQKTHLIDFRQRAAFAQSTLPSPPTIRSPNAPEVLRVSETERRDPRQVTTHVRCITCH